MNFVLQIMQRISKANERTARKNSSRHGNEIALCMDACVRAPRILEGSSAPLSFTTFFFGILYLDTDVNVPFAK